MRTAIPFRGFLAAAGNDRTASHAAAARPCDSEPADPPAPPAPRSDPLPGLPLPVIAHLDPVVRHIAEATLRNPLANSDTLLILADALAEAARNFCLDEVLRSTATLRLADHVRAAAPLRAKRDPECSPVLDRPLPRAVAD